MKRNPIIFGDESIRAILAGKKTQTRRVCKPQPVQDDGLWHVLYPWGEGGHGIYETEADLREEYDPPILRHSRYGAPGDQLWVKETWRSPEDPLVMGRVAYRADGRCGAWIGDGAGGKFFLPHGWLLSSRTRGDHDIGGTYGSILYGDRWRSAIYMPRWASRLLLEVTSVRVERLQEITEADCLAEGVRHLPDLPSRHPYGQDDRWCYFDAKSTEECYGSPRHAFGALWNSVNAKRGYPWESNPLVIKICFRVLSTQGVHPWANPSW